MKSTKVLVAAVLVLSLLLAWSVMGKDKDEGASEKLVWKGFNCPGMIMCQKAAVPTGWIIMSGQGSPAFVHDPDHAWK
jgi:hypothetical protein